MIPVIVDNFESPIHNTQYLIRIQQKLFCYAHIAKLVIKLPWRNKLTDLLQVKLPFQPESGFTVMELREEIGLIHSLAFIHTTLKRPKTKYYLLFLKSSKTNNNGMLGSIRKGLYIVKEWVLLYCRMNWKVLRNLHSFY